MADKIVSRPATDKYREEYDRIFGKKPKNGPQYGVVQSYNWRRPDEPLVPLGPVPERAEDVASRGVDSDLNKPITEDGSDPSSK